MKKLALLAASAAVLAVPAAPASAGCTTTPRVDRLGNNTVSVCDRSVGEQQQYYVTCTLDRDMDGRYESRCAEIVVLEYLG